MRTFPSLSTCRLLICAHILRDAVNLPAHPKNVRTFRTRPKVRTNGPALARWRGQEMCARLLMGSRRWTSSIERAHQLKMSTFLGPSARRLGPLCMSHVLLGAPAGGDPDARLRTAVDCRAAVDCVHEGLRMLPPTLLECATGVSMLRPDTRSRASSVPVAWLMSLGT